MRFELDNTLMDEILFFMENQDGDFLFDTKNLFVFDINNNDFDEEPDLNDENRYISLPEWDSNSGYRLMEKFAAGLKNPLTRQELSAALNRNKGVFRAFRDVLEHYPETEKLWTNYKEKEMKREIIIWYNSLRTLWEMEPIGLEPEDSYSLVLEDFTFREESEYTINAETAAGETAGTISAAVNDSVLQVNNLEVKPEYRGLGIAKTLLAKLLEKADRKNLEVKIEIPT